jgi:hypothetical protein
MPLFSMPVPSAYGQNVKPYDGAKLYFYETGTLIPKPTYYDPEETIAQTHPVVADGSGRFPPIFISGTYKVVLTDKYEIQKWEEDGLPGTAVVQPRGSFDSLTNANNYPANGSLGDFYKVIETFSMSAPSGGHEVVIGDYIIANKDGATGIDADWDIIRGLQSRSRQFYDGGGGDFTITGDSGWVTYYAVASPYLTRDGNWEIEFVISGDVTSTGIVYLIIPGIEFRRVGGPADPPLYQNLVGGNDSGGTIRDSIVTALGTSNVIEMRSTGAPSTRYYCRGSTLVTYKPTWAI